MKYTSQLIGRTIRDTRRKLGVTQKDLALTSGTGIRFLIDLERGKETCEIGKALRVLQTLGIRLTLTPPATTVMTTTTTTLRRRLRVVRIQMLPALARQN